MLHSFTQSDFDEKIEAAYALMKQCRLCPRACGAERLENDTSGFCRSGRNPLIASVTPHYGEEPPLSGVSGSGTIFFGNCSLRCVYCQNYPISQQGNGVERTPGELACQMLWLQEQGCHNLNLVTPTHFMPPVLAALRIARERGFDLPIVYNSSGYESLEALRILDGIVDIYLPDMRYSDDEPAMHYSEAPRYREINRAAVREMFRRLGNLVLDGRGIAQRGLIVRHLVLPGNRSGTEGTMRFLAGEISRDVWISLMGQYFPAYRSGEFGSLARKVTAEEYDDAVGIMEACDLENGWIQEFE